MQKILITGAAGDVGTRLRKLLKGVYSLRVSDIRKPADLGADDEFVAADLGDYEQTKQITAGIDGIVHLGGYSVEGPWETIHKSNIVGCYNLFEAAYRSGVKRIVFASSNHAVGFYPRDRKIGVDVTVRPDSRYGVSKAFGEAVGALYADKHGLRVTCIRIGNVDDKPLDKRRLSIWVKPEDLAQLIRIGLEHPDIRFRDFLRRIRQRSRVVGQQQCQAFRLPPAISLGGFPRRSDGRAGKASCRPYRRPLSGRAILLG